MIRVRFGIAASLRLLVILLAVTSMLVHAVLPEPTPARGLIR